MYILFYICIIWKQSLIYVSIIPLLVNVMNIEYLIKKYTFLYILINLSTHGLYILICTVFFFTKPEII